MAYRQAVEINPASFLSYYQLGETFYRLATEINLESFPFSTQLEEVISKTSQENGSSASVEFDCFNDITFLQSTSHLNNEGFVEEVYRIYLKRSPDVKGKSSFLQNLGNGTLTRQHFLATIRQSGEFTALLRLSGCLMAAISAYRKAIELNPDSYDSYHSLGEALVKMNQLDEAVLVYRRAIELNPNFYKSYSQLGGVLVKQGQLDAALVYQQKAIELQPVLVGAEAYFNLGNIQIQLGRLEEGIVSYQKAIEINPDCAEAYYNLGNVLLVQGNRGQAIRSYYQSNKIHCRKANPHATIPGILLVTFPEFGGTEIVNALASSLSIPFIPISGSYPFDNIIDRESISRLASGMSWSMGYISSSLINFDLISEYLDKIIFHVCDPRKATLLFVNHLAKILQTEPKQLIMYHSILCDNYFALSMTEQISWHIENGYLPQAIKFLKGWLEVIKSHYLHSQILLTKQEDFAANPATFLKSIVNFYEIKEIGRASCRERV
jgi:tetratricopeptide (TPR) repeat protein